MSVIDVKFQTDMNLWSAGAVDGYGTNSIG